MHFELGRDELEHAREVFADAFFRPATARAGLRFIRHVVLDAHLRQMIERGAPTGTRGLGAIALCRRVGRDGRACGVLRAGQLGHVEETPLRGIVDMPLAAQAEDVAPQQGQGFEHLGVGLLQLLVVGRRLGEHTFEFGDAPLMLVGLLRRVLCLLLSLFGLPLGCFGLSLELVVAAPQVEEQPLTGLEIVRDRRPVAHDLIVGTYS